MNDTEECRLVEFIDERGMNSGKAIKRGGHWFVNDLPVGPMPQPKIAPVPIINMSHSTEGDLFNVIIEHKGD